MTLDETADRLYALAPDDFTAARDAAAKQARADGDVDLAKQVKALADPDSADVVRSGRLVRALSYAGFGGVDLEGVVAGSVRTTEPVAEQSDDGIAQAEAAAG